ncbi:SRPBCC domain-containing protein [Sphingomonas phyllosphaerae]|uniref:SRPBCC domain-containing protein n=1 Tax=Sphingomonas phyllosphaerae TaxID=257003 RepID=UPI002412EC66|nr:SRPBCC domain-containing protein [Sphingomonas phyllosphaerae]
MNRELSVERHIEAPVTRVWETMMDRFEEWFCPRPWRAEARQVEWRPGGRSLVVMHGPNGEEMPNEGVILDYQPGRRFVFSDAFTGDWQPSGPFMVGLFEIVSEGSGTRFIATARHWTDESAEQHRTMGFDDGWGAMADQLKTLAEGGTL